MKKFYSCWLVLLLCVKLGQSYSKYGRTCKDIGCLSNEMCVMETDPCSYYQRQNECGSYPTCKKMSNAGLPSCKTYVCPPTKVCRMDGSTPKCVDDASKVGRVGYDTTELKNLGGQSGNVYPNLPRGETTSRPNIGYQPVGQGYAGGQPGSGYPGQPGAGYPGQPAGGYPGQPAGGYPGQQRPNYPQQPYPGYNGYNQQGGYRPQQNGYPNYNNYNNQRYPNNQQGGYNPYRYGQNSGSNPLVDSISSALKNYGTKLLKDAITKQLSGGNRN